MNKKLVAAAVTSALALPMAAHAVKFQTSGHVNRAVMIVDDGTDSDIQHVDGDASSTRFRFKGTEDIGNGLTAGLNFEMQVESNSSNATTMKQTSDSNDGLSTRFAEVFFSGDFGKVSMGQGSDGTDGAAFADLNNAWIAVENATDFAGNIEFVGTGGTPLGVTAGDVTPSYDGGRRDRIRYDTPAIGPLSLAVSHATSDRIDVMGKLAGAAGGAGQYDVRVGYSKRGESTSTDDVIVLSGAFKFSQGTSIAGAWGQASREAAGAEDGEYYYIKLGHDWGNNSVAIDYKDAEKQVGRTVGCTDSVDTSGAGYCGGTSFGIGAVHTMPKPGIDLYAGYRLFTLEDTAAGVGEDDIYTFFVGSRIKFN